MASVKPKAPQTAFFFFCKEHRSTVRNELSKDAANTPESIPASVVAMKLGEMWRALTSDQKLHYQNLCRQDKLRYNTEMETYNGNQ